MGKGTNQVQQTAATTGAQSTTTSPNPLAYQDYVDLLNKAGGVASQPYQGYTGQLTAGINQQQQTGIGNINANANFAVPYIQQGAGYATAAAQPITPQQIQSYLNPYTQQVVNSTQDLFRTQNAEQQQQVIGNAAMQGALGGDRVKVAQAELARQQNLAQNPVIAGLYNQGYTQALSAAQAQQQQEAQAAYSLGNLGVAGQNAALSGAAAQLGAGTLEQQTTQAGLNAAYQQYLQQLAFPYQQTGWLAGITSGIGSQLGGTSSGISSGTSSGTTTSPAPSQAAQYAGLGLAAAGMFLKDGGRVKKFADGGIALPYGPADSFIPNVPITPGAGAPKIAPMAFPAATAPGVPNQQPSSASSMVGDALKMANGIRKNRTAGPLQLGSSVAPAGIGSIEPMGLSPDSGLSSGDVIYRRGGFVRANGGVVPREPNGIYIPSFDDGGIVPAFDDRFAPPVPGNTQDRLALRDQFIAGLGQRGDQDPRWYADEPTDVPLPRSRPMAADQPDISQSPIADTDQGTTLPPQMTSGIGLPATALGYSDTGNDLASAYAMPSTNTKSFGGILPDNWKIPLIAAGFGMLSSKSPFPGVAVGEGGLAGLNAYSAQNRLAQEKAEKERAFDLQTRNVDLAAQRLDQQAREHAKDLALKTQALGETKAQHEFEREKPVDMSPGHILVNRKGDLIYGGDPAAAGLLDKDTLGMMADQYLAGDKSVFQNLGRGAQGSQNIALLRKEVAERLKATGAGGREQAAKMLEFQGLAAGQRALGTRDAQIQMAANEARNMIPVALKASEAVPRTNWMPVNRAIQAYESNTGDPNIVRFGAANFSLVNTYVRAIAPTGVPPESAREHALHMLSTAMSPEQYKAVVDQMDMEMAAALKSPDQVRQKFRDNVTGQPAIAPTVAPAVPPALPTAPRVRQNGHTYERQPDGSYKPVD